MTGYTRLDREVISVGLCTDCGNCAAVCPDKCLIMNYETELPQLAKKCTKDCVLCFESCPGKDIPMLDMDQMLFGRQRNGGYEINLGIGQQFLKGHAVGETIRARSGGGGLVTALLVYALENNIIDAATVAVMDSKRPWRVVPRIATTKEEVMAATQSKDALVPMNYLLPEIVKRGFSRVGFVGLPCHVHALRKMQLLGRPKEFIDRIALVIGLVCGGNWSWRVTEHAIGQYCEISPDQVAKLEYRAGEYPGNFTVTARDGRVFSFPIRRRRILLAAFEQDRCTVCYDYANDEADVSVGDYFGLEMARGAPGMSSAIVRTDKGKKLVEQAQAANYIRTSPVEVEQFYQGLYELKKHGGAYHTTMRKKYGWPMPDYHLPLDYQPLPRKLNITHPQIM